MIGLYKKTGHGWKIWNLCQYIEWLRYQKADLFKRNELLQGRGIGIRLEKGKDRYSQENRSIMNYLIVHSMTTQNDHCPLSFLIPVSTHNYHFQVRTLGVNLSQQTFLYRLVRFNYLILTIRTMILPWNSLPCKQRTKRKSSTPLIKRQTCLHHSCLTNPS